MDKLGAEELRKVVKSLIQATKCAVCLDVLKLDTVVCVNGHVICRDCQRTQRSCPTCRKGFSNVENTAFVRQVLEVIPHTCRHKGCPHVVYKGDEHEKYCTYRYEQCKFAGCSWEGYVKDLSQHFLSQHAKPLLKASEASVQTILNFHLKETKNHSFVVENFGHLFFVCLEYSHNVGVMVITVHPVLTEKPSHDMFYNVKFESDVKRTTLVTKLHLDSVGTASDKNTICVPIAILLQFWNEKDKTLVISSSMSKEK